MQVANGAVLDRRDDRSGLFTDVRNFIARHRWQIPGAPFYLAALLLAVAWLIGLNVARVPRAGAGR